MIQTISFQINSGNSSKTFWQILEIIIGKKNTPVYIPRLHTVNNEFALSIQENIDALNSWLISVSDTEDPYKILPVGLSLCYLK